MELSDRIIGQGYKYRDYLAVFGVESTAPIRLARADQINDGLIDEIGAGYNRPDLDAVRERLAASFPEID